MKVSFFFLDRNLGLFLSSKKKRKTEQEHFSIFNLFYMYTFKIPVSKSAYFLFITSKSNPKEALKIGSADFYKVMFYTQNFLSS